MNKDKEPLLSARDFFRQTLEKLGFANCKPSELTNSDYWLITITAMKSYSKYHLLQCSEVVCDEAKYIHACNDGKGCGIPYCDALCGNIDKQSITNAIENYIKENL